MLKASSLLLGVFFAGCIVPVHAEPTVEVLHWWGSGDAAVAARVLKVAFEKAGGRWIDVPITGGGGAAARILQARFLSGNPPSVVMMTAGHASESWGEQSAFADIDDVAKTDHWDSLLPAYIADSIKYKGKYFAVPTDVHRLNSLFVNTAVLEKAGVSVTPGWPHSWDEFNAAAEKIRKAGRIPLAYGGSTWAEVTLFNAVVLGIGGARFYRDSYLGLDPKALSGPVMIKVFDQMRLLRDDSDRSRNGRSAQLTIEMVVRGDAAMQITGDWAMSEFIKAGKKSGKDFLCLTSPGSGRAFISDTDSFAMFKVSDREQTEGQKLFARVVMSKDVQNRFNVMKGSIPPRLDVPNQDFDVCAQKSMSDFRRAASSGELFSENDATHDAAVAGAISDVVTKHFHSDMSSQEAVTLLVEAVQSAK
jgi:glucose/mannose transport system substrate-binding protein